MASSMVVCAGIGVGSLLLAADGTACLLDVQDACLVGKPLSLIVAIVGYVTLLPLLLCLVAAWIDHRSDRPVEEAISLLPVGNDNPRRVEKPRRVFAYLYVSHLYSAWGDRMWQFAVPILFMEIFVDTLLPSACFSLVMYTMCILMIPSVGALLDRTDRWQAMKYAIVLENSAIIISTAVMVLILLVTNADGTHKPVWTWKLMGLFGVILVCGGAGQVLNDAQTLAIEKDWVVVLTGEDSASLSKLNTTLRRIDLACKILAPLAFGIIMDFAGGEPTTRAMVGAACVGIWNLISTPLEYVMTKEIYELCPELAIKAARQGEDTRSDREREQPVDFEKPRTSFWTRTISRYLTMWKEYAEHPVFLVSVSFCGLYMTVLDGGALFTAYLKWRGVQESTLGAGRGLGAVLGLFGTFCFPAMLHCLQQVERIAVVSVWLFLLTLAPVAAAFVVEGQTRLSDYLMLGGMVLSRVWLWSCDLAETQIMQEWVEPHRRGTINSMQTATSQLFFILIQLVGMVFHDPSEFQTLVFWSVGSLALAALGFSAWYCRCGAHRDAYLVDPHQLNSTKATREATLHTLNQNERVKVVNNEKAVF